MRTNLPMPPAPKLILAALALVALALASALLAPPPRAAHAQENPLGATAAVEARPLQELVRDERAPGPLFLSIPFAEVFGGTHGYTAYCSPHIRSTNGSNRTVQEMLAGVRYRDRDGRPVGSTITRFFLLRIGAEDTHYFANIDATDCNGLSAELEVLRCVYEDGSSCVDDVVASGYGAIPLALAAAPPSGPAPDPASASAATAATTTTTTATVAAANTAANTAIATDTAAKEPAPCRMSC